MPLRTGGRFSMKARVKIERDVVIVAYRKVLAYLNAIYGLSF